MAEANKLEEQKKNALTVLGTMLDCLGLDAEWVTEIKGNRMIIKLSSNDAGRIIGRRGSTLESLQLLLNRIMFKGEDGSPLIMLDIDGYSSGNVTAGGEQRGDRGERRERGERGGRSRERRERRGRDSGVSEEELRMLALDKAKEVKRWGEPVELAKMNAHDRRIIHITLQDDPELETSSEGEGAMKKVIISLKKPEN